MSALFDVVTVHCLACSHTVESTDPIEAHDRMEEHYAAKHAKLIQSIIRS
jgi:hypothetical protein